MKLDTPKLRLLCLPLFLSGGDVEVGQERPTRERSDELTSLRDPSIRAYPRTPAVRNATIAN